MVRSIWKYELPRSGPAVIEMPARSEVLSVANQDGHLVLWALVYTAAPTVKRDFYVALTGGDEPLDMRSGDFIGSVLLADGRFVVHVFEVPR